MKTGLFPGKPSSEYYKQTQKHLSALVDNWTCMFHKKEKRVYKRAKHYKHNSDWSEYKNLQHKVRHMLKHNYETYITIVIPSSNNNQLFWQYMKA